MSLKFSHHLGRGEPDRSPASRDAPRRDGHRRCAADSLRVQPLERLPCWGARQHTSAQVAGAADLRPANAPADATISVVSHEANETITDGLGNAWYDTSGNENGDQCAYKYGTALGSINGGQYNQNIGTGHYEMQQEWSNHSSGCVLTGT